jgi:hypothetical protein
MSKLNDLNVKELKQIFKQHKTQFKDIKYNKLLKHELIKALEDKFAELTQDKYLKLYRGSNDKWKLEIDNFNKLEYVFFVSMKDDNRYSTYKYFAEYKINKPKLIEFGEDDDEYDIAGGMPLHESKKLLQKLEKDNQHMDGIRIVHDDNNDEVVLWNFNKLKKL